MINPIINKIKKSPLQLSFVKLFVFVLILYVMDFTFGNLLSYFYFKQSSGFLYRTTYSIERANAEILIFGSSRASHHYVSGIIEEKLNRTCYNVGAGGQSTFYHYALLKCILKRYSPKTIIFDLKNEEFKKYDSDYDKISELLPYNNSHKEIHPIIELRGPYEKYKLISKIYPYNSLIFKIAIGNLEFNKTRSEQEADIKGFVPLTQTMEEPNSIDSSYKKYEIDFRKIVYYENFIKDCKRQGVQIVIIVSPFYTKSNQHDYSIVLGEEIAKKYGVKFYDFFKDPLFTSNNSLFADETHLNKNGAQLFTNKVVNKILNN